ncbi:MAG: hypothetical protein RBS02_00275 [Steroidobacteraceae bacterium]|jgi:hypothetical protein|nr:hypothetical protein [Steroidobacteraceae bacterium]
MDEYTLSIAAKLAADRRRLERQQRATSPQPEPAASRNKSPEYFRAVRNFLRAHQWPTRSVLRARTWRSQS